MSELALHAVLKGNKGAATSEYMDEATAKAELAKVIEELNSPHGADFLTLGETTTVNRREVLSITLVEPPSFGIA